MLSDVFVLSRTNEYAHASVLAVDSYMEWLLSGILQMPKRDDVYAKAVWRMEFQARRQNITLHDIDKKHELFHRAYLQYGILTENNRYLRARWKSFLETGSRAAKSAGRPKKAPKPAKPSKPRDDSE